jgi:chromosome segregation ATPase
LATHLLAQQQQLDRRAADLHAQLAHQENGARSARLWFRERQQELSQREAEVIRREREIEAKESLQARADREHAEALERTKGDQRRHSEAFGGRQRDLDDRRRSLDRQEAENAAVSAALARSASEQQQFELRLREQAACLNRQAAAAIDHIGRFLRGEDLPRDHREAAALANEGTGEVDLVDAKALFDELATGLQRLRTRQCNLEEAEALLIDGQTELEDTRRRLDSDRRAWQERCEAERQEATQIQVRAELETEKRLHALQARADHLERRSAAVDQLRAEVLRTQRETLELRLATDELWAQMMGAAPPAALSQSLAQIRGKLADQYRLERAEMAAQQQELEMLVARLDEQRERLRQQKQELERWAANRQADMEGQAARLVARENELDRRKAELDGLRLEQQNDRHAYEREIRRLLGQLRRVDSFDAAAHAA